MNWQRVMIYLVLVLAWGLDLYNLWFQPREQVMLVTQAFTYTELAFYITCIVIVCNILRNTLYKKVEFVPKTRGCISFAMFGTQLVMVVMTQLVALVLYAMQYLAQFLYSSRVNNTWLFQGIHLEYILKGFFLYIIYTVVIMIVCLLVKEILDKFGWAGVMCVIVLTVVYLTGYWSYLQNHGYYETIASRLQYGVNLIPVTYVHMVVRWLLVVVIGITGIVLIQKYRKRECYRSPRMKKVQGIAIMLLFMCLSYTGFMQIVLDREYYYDVSYTYYDTNVEQDIYELFEGVELPTLITVRTNRRLNGKEGDTLSTWEYTRDTNQELSEDAIAALRADQIIAVYNNPAIQRKANIVNTPNFQVTSEVVEGRLTVTVTYDTFQILSVVPYANLRNYTMPEEGYIVLNSNFYRYNAQDPAVYVPGGKYKLE